MMITKGIPQERIKEFYRKWDSGMYYAKELCNEFGITLHYLNKYIKEREKYDKS